MSKTNDTDIDKMIVCWAKEYQRIFKAQNSNDVVQLKEHLGKLEAIKQVLTAQLELVKRMITCNKAQIKETQANLKRVKPCLK